MVLHQRREPAGHGGGGQPCSGTNLGITDIRFEVLDFAQFLSLVKARKVTGPFLSSWLMDYPSPQTYIAPLYTAGAADQPHRLRQRPRSTSCIAEGDRAPSMAAGITAYQAAEDVILDDMPLMPAVVRHDPGRPRRPGDARGHRPVQPDPGPDVQVVG